VLTTSSIGTQRESLETWDHFTTGVSLAIAEHIIRSHGVIIVALITHYMMSSDGDGVNAEAMKCHVRLHATVQKPLLFPYTVRCNNNMSW